MDIAEQKYKIYETFVQRLYKRIFSNREAYLARETGWHIGDGSMGFYLNKGKYQGLYQLRGGLEEENFYKKIC